MSAARETQPAFPRNILLAVTGLSPQIVTETLYALATQPQPWIPQAVHLITTREGAERARLSLLSEQPGWFARLRADYNLPAIDFDEDQIHTLTDGSGRPLDDIRNQQDNIAAADQITEQVRQFTADPDTCLHVSIAGGRKTLGFYLGYALSLYGRPQDRLSHVLVSEPYESSWEFFYPTPYSRVITTRDNKLVDTRKAEVTLGEIPFVRLRAGLPTRLLFKPGRFSEAVDAVSQSQVGDRLIYQNHTLTLGGETVVLPRADLAFYLWLAHQRQSDQAGCACPPAGITDKSKAISYLLIYDALRSTPADPEAPDRTTTALQSGMDKNFFERRKSRVNKHLRDQLGQRASPYLINRSGTRPHWRHGLILTPEQIRIELVGAGLASLPLGSNAQSNIKMSRSNTIRKTK